MKRVVTKEAQKDKKGFLLKYGRFLLAGLNLAVLLVYEKLSPEKHDVLSRQLCLPKLLKNFLVQYSSHLAASFFHELGHALVARIVNGDKIDMHLGGGDEENPFLVFEGLSLDGLCPNVGYANYTQPYRDKDQVVQKIMILTIASYCKQKGIEGSEFSVDDVDKKTFKKAYKEVIGQMKDQGTLVLDKQKLAMILLAGGIGGIIGYTFLKFVCSSLINFYQTKKSFFESLIEALHQAIQLDSVLVSQFTNMLFPFSTHDGNESDAFKVYHECCDVDPETLKEIELISFLFSLGVEFYLLQNRNFYLGEKFSMAYFAYLSKKLNVVSLNLLLNGYLRFHL